MLGSLACFGLVSSAVPAPKSPITPAQQALVERSDIVLQLRDLPDDILDKIMDAIWRLHAAVPQRSPTARRDFVHLALAAPSLFAPAIRAAIRLAQFSNNPMCEMFPSSCLTDELQEASFRVGDVANEVVKAKQGSVGTRKWYIVMPRRDKHRRLLPEGAPARMTSRKWTLLWVPRATIRRFHFIDWSHLDHAALCVPPENCTSLMDGARRTRSASMAALALVIPTLLSLRDLEIVTHVVAGLEAVSTALSNRPVQTSLSLTFTVHVARSMEVNSNISDRMRLLTEAVRSLPRSLSSFTLDVMDENPPDALYLRALSPLAKAVPLVTETLSLALPVFTREMVADVPFAPTLREISLSNWPAPRIFPVSALVSRLPPSLVSLMLRSVDFSLTDLVHPLVLPPRLCNLQLHRVRTQRVLDQRYIAHLQQHGPVGAVLDAFTTNARHLATMHLDQLDGTNIDPAGWLEHVPWSVNRLSIVGHQLLDVVADAIIARYAAAGPRKSGAPRVSVIVSECSFSLSTRERLCATPGIDVTLRQCFVPGCQDEVNLDDLLL
ncbi:hypothetical protein AMAG_13968 [Allomyces macrogynus ATCC 38327]|uniref:Uncharacterized protein n=1 Tax=Allomyces macrogynus (strain ATCC 38327) TaxID=578462 RepID=A0A0L0T2Z8_ALLM3|nr:hypothetical protein AMAG_13968 [Allomyces macrogynus ATCC 38327]|eukprot:KNE69106.1 hypothetical protein AMAG_13968 [Allomyces macrogynus ATCC 38327]